VIAALYLVLDWTKANLVLTAALFTAVYVLIATPILFRAQFRR